MRTPTSICNYEVVEFSIYPDGHRAICMITYDALIDHFGATGERSMVPVLLGNMNKISPVAEQIWRDRPVGCSVVVTSADVAKSRSNGRSMSDSTGHSHIDEANA